LRALRRPSQAQDKRHGVSFSIFFLDKVGFWAHNMHLKSLRQLRANKRFSPPEEKAAKGKEPQNGNGKRKL
jgi:hypothetical protein